MKITKKKKYKQNKDKKIWTNKKTENPEKKILQFFTKLLETRSKEKRFKFFV